VSDCLTKALPHCCLTLRMWALERRVFRRVGIVHVAKRGVLETGCWLSNCGACMGNAIFSM
jgi:hypothetical protein